MIPGQPQWQQLQTSLASAWRLFQRRAFTTDQHVVDGSAAGHSDQELEKTLSAFDLTLLGIGAIVGAGVFVITGVAAKEHAGPAVVVSYILAAFAALLAALAYTEYVTDIPLPGGAYQYIRVTFGEYPAWIVATNMIIEYTVSSAAVARGFSSYMALLLGRPADAFKFWMGPFQADPLALLLVVLLSLILCKGMRESSTFNAAVTGLNIAIILFVLAAGFPHADLTNLTPFAPNGMRGVFSAASLVFFGFVGFDMIGCQAAEVIDPAKAYPIAIVGSLGISTALYVLMCLCICSMQPYYMLDVHAPFGEAFRAVGWGWAAKIVSVGALTGITTSLLVSLMGQARIYMALGRDGLMPAFLASVHPATKTPIVATLLTMFTAGVLSFLVNIDTLASLVSIGTLFVFFCVHVGVLYRRYQDGGAVPKGDTEGTQGPWYQRSGPRLAIGITGIALSSLAIASGYVFGAPLPALLAFAAVFTLATVSLVPLPVVYVPKTFRTPCLPLLPALGMFTTLFLIAALGWLAYVRFAAWFVIGTIVYVFYGAKTADQVDEKSSSNRMSGAEVGLQPTKTRYQAVAAEEH